jgi:hypothetical protein
MGEVKGRETGWIGLKSSCKLVWTKRFDNFEYGIIHIKLHLIHNRALLSTLKNMEFF